MKTAKRKTYRRTVTALRHILNNSNRTTINKQLRSKILELNQYGILAIDKTFLVNLIDAKTEQSLYRKLKKIEHTLSIGLVKQNQDISTLDGQKLTAMKLHAIELFLEHKPIIELDVPSVKYCEAKELSEVNKVIHNNKDNTFVIEYLDSETTINNNDIDNNIVNSNDIDIDKEVIA